MKQISWYFVKEKFLMQLEFLYGKVQQKFIMMCFFQELSHIIHLKQLPIATIQYISRMYTWPASCMAGSVFAIRTLNIKDVVKSLRKMMPNLYLLDPSGWTLCFENFA